MFRKFLLYNSAIAINNFMLKYSNMFIWHLKLNTIKSLNSSLCMLQHVRLLDSFLFFYHDSTCSFVLLLFISLSCNMFIYLIHFFCLVIKCSFLLLSLFVLYHDSTCTSFLLSFLYNYHVSKLSFYFALLYLCISH